MPASHYQFLTPDTIMKTPLIEARSGTYVLILKAARPKKISVGQLGTFMFPAGFYMYIGSAFGPGGLRARVGRHLRKFKNNRWHVDYVSSEIHIIEVWFSVLEHRQECHWAALFSSMNGVSLPVNRLGSSDCSCRTHLFHSVRKPGFRLFKNRAECDLQCFKTGILPDTTKEGYPKSHKFCTD